jgi:nitrogen fixation protein NifQ
MSIALQKESLEDFYNGLMSTRRGYPVEDTLARMLASWSAGIGKMPEWLGLSESEFRNMMQFHFPGYPQHEFEGLGKPLDLQRMDESEDLKKLLLQSRSGGFDFELWIVDIMVAGCLGNDHLWQDLGLWQRADLSRLMKDNFEPLALRNDRDMKWKKFLYKQLCEAEGIYTCRAPSCEVCVDYEHCFETEE